MTISNDLGESWIVMRIDIADDELGPEEEVRDDVLRRIHQLAAENGIEDMGKEYNVFVENDGCSENTYEWTFGGTLKNMVEFLQEVKNLSNYPIGDESDPMQGEYPEVLHEGRL